MRGAAAAVWFLLSALCQPLRAGGSAAAVAPQDCSLDCIRQGGFACEYCRITRSIIQQALGFNGSIPFGSCIPWPCFKLLGNEDREICEHFVHAPNDVKVEFVDDPNLKSDTIVVSWKPSSYGIAFLRGFQVTLQALGSSSISCQLFLFPRHVSLTPSEAHTVYMSDPFPGLSLGAQFAVTVMSLPVPEKWEKFYSSTTFSTRSCAEKIGLEKCKHDWYPRHVEVQQEGTIVTVTFNLAPPNLGIRNYFSLCYANGKKEYKAITPSLAENQTHHSFQLDGLQEGTNYTCELAADQVDAVRKIFNVHVQTLQTEDPPVALALAVTLPLCLITAGLLGAAVLAAISCWRSKLGSKAFHIKSDLIRQHEEESRVPEEVVTLQKDRLTPPRLLICYSGRDGPAHVKAVNHFGAFVQKHMATQVCLDLWDSLGVAEEGYMAWYCRHIRDSDFILVICSRGLRRRPEPPGAEGDDEDDEEEPLSFGPDARMSEAVVQLIGEEVGRAKARGQDLSKYMAAVFQYSQQADIPVELGLVQHYTLTRDLALLFSHLHGVALHRPGGHLKIGLLSEEGFAELPAGAALQSAISDAEATMRRKMEEVE
uniref:Si:ch211-207e14.4 n=1 Tax=Oryzias sinensis TaxID=183150 RepID=A0A8C7Y571_9TELE